MHKILAMLLVLIWACSSDLPPSDSTSSGTYRAPIVGGQAEAGYAPVGALALETIQGYFGGFCSSTLIAPDWVLTAAHCIDGAVEQAQEIGFNLVPGHVNFVMGSNANPSRGYRRPSGVILYRAAEIYIHPNYDASSQLQDDDIALIRLQDAVYETEPYPLYRQDLTTKVGEVLTYVGFGTSNPNREGFQFTGQKRRTSLPIDTVGPAQYVSSHSNSGVCFGDSGGPGLITVNGQRYVAGVNSTVSGESPTCLLSSNQVRVDAYQTWIDAVMGQSPNCGGNTALCLCAEACTSAGYCDNTKCGSLDCRELGQCTSQCSDGLCASRCYVTATSDAKRGYADLADCASRRCPGGDLFCLQDNCASEVDFCYGDDAFPSGERSCRDIYSCLNACTDSTCVQNCYNSGTLDAQRAYGEFYSCMERRCFALQADYTAFNNCLLNDCGGQLNSCMPDERCSLLGGDCASGRACSLEGWGSTYCELSANIQALESCNAAQVTCADGYYCRNLGDGPRCYPNCFDDGDCEFNATCKILRGASVEFGQCEVPCSDLDGDGDCDDDDCAPRDALRFQGAEELCGDGLDGDCDGSIDEECGACNDSDGDGSCDETDCDPLNAGRSPNLSDVCGDFIDNDCDDAVDENCESQRCDPQSDPACQPPIVFFDDERAATDGGCDCTIKPDAAPTGYMWALMCMLSLLRLRKERA